MDSHSNSKNDINQDSPYPEEQEQDPYPDQQDLENEEMDNPDNQDLENEEMDIQEIPDQEPSQSPSQDKDQSQPNANQSQSQEPSQYQNHQPTMTNPSNQTPHTHSIDESENITPTLQLQSILQAENQSDKIPILSCNTCNEMTFNYLLTKNQVIRECPTCKKITLVPIEDFISVQTDSYAEKQPPLCYNVEEHNEPADKFCLNCNKNMCKKCLELHNKFFKEGHQLENVFVKSNKNCTQHVYNIIDRYCTKCHKEICVVCEPEHNEHYNDIVLFEDYLNENKLEDIIREYNDIKGLIENNEEIEANFINELNEEIIYVRKKYTNSVNKINEEYNNKMNEYNKKIKDLRNKMKEAKNDRKKKINSEFERKKQIVEDLTNKIFSIQELYDKYTNDNYLLMKYLNTLFFNYLENNCKYNYDNIQNIIYNCKFNKDRLNLDNDTITYDNILKIDDEEEEKDKENKLFIHNNLQMKYDKIENYLQNYLILKIEQNQNEEKLKEYVNKIKDKNFDKYSQLRNITNQDNFNMYNDNSKEVIFCSKCYMIPLLTFINKEEVSINCRNCKTEKLIKIPDFLNNLSKTRPPVTQSMVPPCSNNDVSGSHGKRPSFLHCVICDLYYCKECSRNHATHFPDHNLVYSYLNIKTKCPLHKENFVSYFCNENRQNLCEKCFLSLTEDKQRSSNLKEFSTIINENKLNEINSVVENAENKIKSENENSKNEILTDMNQQKKNVKTTYKKNVDKIKENSKKKIEKYCDDINKLNKLIKQEINNQLKLIGNEDKDKKNKLDQLNKTINDFLNLYKQNTLTNNNLLNVYQHLLSNFNYYNQYIYNSLCNINVNCNFNFMNYPQFKEYREAMRKEELNKKNNVTVSRLTTQRNNTNTNNTLNTNNTNAKNQMNFYNTQPVNTAPNSAVPRLKDQAYMTNTLTQPREQNISQISQRLNDDAENKSLIKNKLVKEDKEEDYIKYFKDDTIIDFDKIKNEKELQLSEVSLDKFKLIKKISSHNNVVLHIFLLSDGRLSSCSYDNTILIYNKDTYKIDVKIEEEDRYSLLMKYVNLLGFNKLVSCSKYTMKIWEIAANKYRLLYTIKAHKDNIIKVIPINKDKFASCSADTTIKIWDNNSYSLIHELTDHKGPVTSICLLSTGILCSGGLKEQCLIFWDIENYKAILTIPGIETVSPDSLFESKDKKLLVGGKGQLYIIDILNNYNLEMTIKNENYGNILCFSLIRDGSILIGNSFGKILKLDDNYNIKDSLAIHKNWVNCLLVVGDNKVISCSNDKLIKIFNY